MKIRKLTAAVMALVLAMSLAACGGSQSGSAGTQTQETQQKEAEAQAEAQEDEAETQESAEAAETEAEAGKEDVAADETGSDDGNKILILYFSANNIKTADVVSSATPLVDGASSVEWIANVIHENVGGDLVPIIPSTDYPTDYDELADYAKQERDDNGRPAFEDLGVDPASYDTIFIGYPVWWYTVPMIVETFLDTYDLSGKTIVPFNTHAGSGDGGTYETIREREPGATVLQGIDIAGADAGDEDARSDVQEWLQELNLN